MSESKASIRPSESTTVQISNPSQHQNQQQQRHCHHHHHHTEQYTRMEAWLEESRRTKRELIEQGVSGNDLQEAMASLNITYKEKTRNNRCIDCWHDRSRCICSELLDMSITSSNHHFVNITGLPAHLQKIKIIVWMHHKEYMSAGNSGKLLLKMFPQITELFLFGKKGELDRLEKELLLASSTSSSSSYLSPCAILWPGETSISLTTFLEDCFHPTSKATKTTTTGSLEMSPSSSASSQIDHSEVLRFVIIDGTYHNARNMYKTLRRRMQKDGDKGTKQNHHPCMPSTIHVHPVSESIFHRAQKTYGKAQRQQLDKAQSLGLSSDTSNWDNVRRVSTAEACGLLFTELLSGDTSIEQAIVHAVKINNQALKASDTV